jgi:hypothetical protein
MSESSDLDQFFSTSNQELFATVNRLDKLIGGSHWLSVGTYKETLLKKALRRVVPQKYSIDNGFVVAANEEGKVIRSTQTDILIWDSTNYSPLFRDEDFVLIPPEACKIMIEVKGVLTRTELKKTLANFDSMVDFCFTPLLQQFDIKKYVFAFDVRKVKFPDTVFRTIASSYSQSKKITLEERMHCLKSWRWPQENRPWPLLAIDGVFILSSGFILRRERMFREGVRFLFNSFSVKSKNESQVYSVFESEILSSLGQFSRGKQGLWYIDQAGLLSLRAQIRVKPSEPKFLMIFPKVMKADLYNDINHTQVFEEF